MSGVDQSHLGDVVAAGVEHLLRLAGRRWGHGVVGALQDQDRQGDGSHLDLVEEGRLDR